MRKTIFFFLVGGILITTVGCQETVDTQKHTDSPSTGQVFKSNIVAEGAQIQRAGTGYQFTEGPAVDAQGNVYFTDQPNNRIYKWTPSGEISLFHESPQRANGLFFDKRGKLLACADLYSKLIAIDMEGNIEVLVENYQNQRLNGPNDLWPDPKGGIYFTDPYYQRRYWDRTESEIDGEHIYYLTPDQKQLIRVVDDFVKPNGIIGTPDGKKLYIADIGDSKIYVYDIQSDGILTNKQFFAPEGSDGMTIDNQGNVYLTNKTVSVFDAIGKKIEAIEVPERPSNVCFGGPERRILFITARTSVYTLKMQVNGV